MLYSIVYPIARLFLRFLVWAFSIEFFTRFNFMFPSQLLGEFLKQYGAQIGEEVTFTAPITFHNLPDKSNNSFRNLSVGSHCYFGRHLFLDLKDKITIADNVTLAMDVMLLTHTDVAKSPLYMQAIPQSQGAISIAAGAYLGARVTVLQAVTIGEMSVVAAGAVVVADVPSRTMVGGVPAKEIKRIVV